MSEERFINYRVIATVVKGHEDEYLDWLKGGHVQAVIKETGLSVEISIIDNDSDTTATTKIVSNYIFPSRKDLQYYFDEVAPELRLDGKTRFLDSGKVLSMERTIGEVVFSLKK